MSSLKNVLIVILLIAITPSVFSQKAPIKFGKIDEKDLNMTVYDKDSSASAVILCDFGDTYMEYSTTKGSFEMIYLKHLRVKIFKADADVVSTFANIEIPIRRIDGQNQDVITDLKAASYQLENGKVKDTKMDKSNVFETKQYDKFFIKKFTIPEVKDGVILEYTYRITSDFYFYPRTWYFQGSYPTILSEYRFAYPEYFYYAFNQEGYNRLTTNEKTGTSQTVNITSTDRSESGKVISSSMSTNSITMNVTNFRWGIKDVPALRAESFMTTPSDYFDKMEFQLNSVNFPGSLARIYSDNWNRFSKELLEDGDIGTKLRKRGAVEDLAKSLVKDKTQPKEKLIAITDYVKKNINVKKIGYLLSDASHKKVLEDKVGTVGDVNLLLGALLMEAGFKVKPILLSTRSNGRVAKNYPMISRFNYLIMQVQVDTSFMLVDAAESNLPTGVLPYDVLNGQGLLLDVANPEWINLQASKTVDLINIDATIEDGKILRGTLQSAMKSYSGLNQRTKIAQDGEEKQAKSFLEKLVKNGSLKSFKYDNVQNPYESLKGKFEFETTDFMDVNSEHIYLNPLLCFGYTANPLKKAERLYPVDFAHPQEDFYNFSLKIPDGYVVEELPKSAKMAWQDGSVLFQYIVVPADANGIIKINSKILIKKPVFTADEYADLKKTFEQIVAKQSEQIVFKKQSK